MIHSNEGTVELEGSFRDLCADLGVAIQALINNADGPSEIRRMVSVMIRVLDENPAVHEVMDLVYNAENDDTDEEPNPEEMA